MHDTPTIADRLESACIAFTDTPDGYEIDAGDGRTIHVRPSPSDPARAWVTVTRPDRRERDTGGYSVDDYDMRTEHVASFVASKIH